jgi:hypothetical protein
MTFLTKHELLEMIDGFTVERLEEKEEDGDSATGRPIHTHIFEVILRKGNIR